MRPDTVPKDTPTWPFILFKFQAAWKWIQRTLNQGEKGEKKYNICRPSDKATWNAFDQRVLSTRCWCDKQHFYPFIRFIFLLKTAVTRVGLVKASWQGCVLWFLINTFGPQREPNRNTVKCCSCIVIPLGWFVKSRLGIGSCDTRGAQWVFCIVPAEVKEGNHFTSQMGSCRGKFKWS